MDEAARLEAKALARAKLHARRRRERTIRRRTLHGSLALFAVVWAIVFAQLLSGNDPALGDGAGRAQRRAVASEPAPRSRVRAVPVPELEEGEEEEEGGLGLGPEVEPEPEPEPEPLVTSAS